MSIENSPRRALVTGGSHGIGLAIAKRLVLDGLDVAILSRSQQKLENARTYFESEGRNILALECDVLSEEEIQIAWGLLLDAWGGVDVLVNNVGGGGRWGSEDILKSDSSVWSEVYQKNAGSTIDLTMKSLPYMVSKGWGRVITITSINAHYPAGRAWFDLAKTAQRALMRNLASNRSLVRSGVTFNSVAPGAVLIEDTGWDDFRKNQPLEFERFAESLPLGRLGFPEEVASLVSFIASDQASYLNGAAIMIDGGEASAL